MPPRMLPTDVVSTIDRELPWVKDLHTELGKKKQAEFRYRAIRIVPGILRLVGRVPDELFAGLSSEDMTRFVIAETSLRDAIAVALNSANNLEWPRLSDNVDCVAAIRTVLQKCPDQALSESSKQLGFIKDKTFRTTLGVDLGSAERAVPAGEWKTATVLAASVAEALLLWAIQQQSLSDRSAAIGRAAANGKVKKNLPGNDLVSSDWMFHQYIEVAFELGQIDERTANRCRDAKGYRNLIHAGAAQREKEECNRTTAHGALCAVYGTIKDLEERHPNDSV